MNNISVKTGIFFDFCSKSINFMHIYELRASPHENMGAFHTLYSQKHNPLHYFCKKVIAIANMKTHNSLRIYVCHICGKAAIIPKIIANLEIENDSNIFIPDAFSF